MGYLKHIVLCLLVIGCTTDKDLAHAPALRPYVQQLKESTAPKELRAITTMAKPELILLLHGYGTGIRNRWLHGDRDPALATFFRTNGVTDAEGASMVIPWRSNGVRGCSDFCAFCAFLRPLRSEV